MSEHGRARSSDGTRVPFDVEGRGRPLVLVHGLGDDRGVWRGLVARLSEDFRCVTLDLRGHGQSSGATDFDPFVFARDVVAVVAALGLERPYFVGHSLGGFAASIAATQVRTRGVINIDQPLDLRWLSARVRAFGEELHRRAPGDIVCSVLDELGWSDLEPAELARLRASRAKLSREVLLGVWLPLLRDEGELAAAVRAAVRGIDTPYLSLHGSGVPPGYAALLEELIPGALLEDWGEQGHFPHLGTEERFVERVRAFALASPD